MNTFNETSNEQEKRRETLTGGIKTVAIAMSGGVDSSVCAAILKDRGYRVFGVMLKLWSDGDENQNRCCTPRSVEDAREVADSLDIPFYTLDYRNKFKRQIVDYFIHSHQIGETPNPCVFCNEKVRFNDFLTDVVSLGADYFATGHYAKIICNEKGNWQLQKPKDTFKDQTYMLYRLSSEQLSRAIFPLGDLDKSEVRKIAEKKGLVIHSKSDSQDLCFLGKDGQEGFFKKQAPELLTSGEIVEKQGGRLGEHQGLSLYTIGQRKGLNLTSPYPLYAISKDPENNRLIVGSKEESYFMGLIGALPVLVDGMPDKPRRIKAQIRYKGKKHSAMLFPSERGLVKIIFDAPQRDICPGQSAVFYDKDLLVGGAVIKQALPLCADPPPTNNLPAFCG